MKEKTYTENLTLEDVLDRLSRSYRVRVLDRRTFEICSSGRTAFLYFERWKPEYGDGAWNYTLWWSGDEPDWQISDTLSDALADIAEEQPSLKERGERPMKDVCEVEGCGAPAVAITNGQRMCDEHSTRWHHPLDEPYFDATAAEVINDLALRLNLNAVKKEFWDCETCDGEGWLELKGEPQDADVLVTTRGSNTTIVTDCPVCDGDGRHRDLGKALMLIVSKFSEALEALREPELDGVCDGCEPIGYGPMDIARRDACTKCLGSGEAIGGSRFGEELMDGVIRALELAAGVGVDIERTLREKVEYNLRRAKKHGKEF